MFTITQKSSGRSMTLADHCEAKVHSDVQDTELIAKLAGKYNWQSWIPCQREIHELSEGVG